MKQGMYLRLDGGAYGALFALPTPQGLRRDVNVCLYDLDKYYNNDPCGKKKI